MRTSANNGKSKPVGRVGLKPNCLILLRSGGAFETGIHFLNSGDDLFGFPRALFLEEPDKFAGLLHPEDLVALPGFFAKAIEEQGGVVSYRVRHADGRYRRWHEEVRPLPPGVNFPAQWVGCGVLHARRTLSAHRSLMARARLDGFIHACLNPVATGGPSAPASPDDARLAYALREANDGLWDWDLTNDQVYYSPRWKALLGYADHELANHLSTWEQLTDPADRERVLHAASAYVAGLESRFEVDFRMRHKEGHWVEVLSCASLVRDARGRPWRLVGTHLDITARKRAETQLREANKALQQRAEHANAESRSAEMALRQSEERLRLAMEAANQGFYDLNVQTGECVVSPEYARMLGYEPEEFVETNAAWIERLHPDDRDAVARNYHEYVAGVRPVYAVEFRQRTKTGDWKWILSLGRIVAHSPDGRPLRMLGTHTDITQRKAAEDELKLLNETLEQRVIRRTESLRRSEERFRTLAEATFEGVVLSRHGVILDCNEQFARMVGCSRESIIGRKVLDFVVPEWRERVLAMIQAGTESRIEHEVLCADGSCRLVEVNARSPDGPEGVRVTVLRDNTERRRAEAELAAQRQELLRFQRFAEISEISAGVLHQIGQPLTAVFNNVSAARMVVARCSNPECNALDALLDSDACLQNVRAAMERLRALAHPERALRESKDINAVVADAVGLLRVEAQAARIRLLTVLDPALPPVLLDDVQISQALINILRNACHAVGECALHRREVTVTTRRAGPDAVAIEVSDRGTGIAPGMFDRMFEPFFTTKPDGMGVGLSLCRTIIRAHGGTITAGNSPDAPGATFRITLPVTPAGHA